MPPPRFSNASKSQSVPKSLHLRSFSMVSSLPPETTGQTRAFLVFQVKLIITVLKTKGGKEEKDIVELSLLITQAAKGHACIM